MPTVKRGMHQRAVFTARKREASMPRRVFMGGLIAYRSNPCQPQRYRAGQRVSRGGVLAGVLMVLLAVTLTLLAGCSTMRFYQQAVTGQARLLWAREDVDRVLARSDIDPTLRAALLDAQTATAFAQTQLQLDVDGRYGSYVDLNREFVVWNLVVTPVDSVKPLTWCFPIAGCVSYRGYFAEQLARETAATFDSAEFDTYVGGVPAYSTLGWFNDPLLSSFIFWPRAARAELLFHELAHGKLYVAGDTEFNESFATYVADFGLPLFLQDGETVRGHRQARRERARFNGLLLQLRARLEADFAERGVQQESEALAAVDAVLELRKRRYAQARACLAEAAEEFSDARWLTFFDQPPNMARLSLVGAYQRWVEAFGALHREQHNDLAAFYAAAQKLAALDADARLAELERLSALASEQRVESKGNNQYANDVECEALAHHAADGHLAG